MGPEQLQGITETPGRGCPMFNGRVDLLGGLM